MLDWLKNIFSPRQDTADDNLVEKQTDEQELRDSNKQENIARGSSSDDDADQ
ncbi:hypothetical protein ACQKP8_23980 [Photobacterium alginatilyticum]|uniref:hypothetical protein n=1 Tax=Photobacterium alginatilyticum TaxID=1775171 RepID=UPI0013702116|nr:hypothetical protein [Photobacterium alginatilyticum]